MKLMVTVTFLLLAMAAVLIWSVFMCIGGIKIIIAGRVLLGVSQIMLSATINVVGTMSIVYFGRRIVNKVR